VAASSPAAARKVRLAALAAGKIHFLLGEVIERRFSQAKGFRQQWLWRVPDPVGDAEGAEFGKIAVVEDQDEMTGSFAETLQHVAVAARKIPDVAGIEIVGLGQTVGIDHGGADAALEHERPLRCGGVPVQLAHRAGLKLHRHAGDSLRDRQLRDGRLLAKTVADHLAFGFLQRELEGRQLLARQIGIGNVVHEAWIAGPCRLRSAQCGQCGNAGGCDQKFPALRIGHGALPIGMYPSTNGDAAWLVAQRRAASLARFTGQLRLPQRAALPDLRLQSNRPCETLKHSRRCLSPLTGYP
jgi:hypothetical protein